MAASNVDASGEAVSSAAAMVKDPKVISTEEELTALERDIKKQVREGKKAAWNTYLKPILKEKNECIALDPENPDHYKGMARVLIQQGRPEEATRYYEKAKARGG